MTTLLFIREAKEKNILLLGVSEEGDSARYKVSRILYQEIGAPLRGEALSEEMLELIKKEDLSVRARIKALSLLSYSDKSERMLKDKLSQSGFPKEIAEEVSREMVSLGYIDENRQLERIILNEANIKLKGPVRIIQDVRAKGYSSDSVRGVLSALIKSGEIDLKANAKKLLEKKHATELTIDEKKTILYKNGYKI